jgi:hypothetical protein
MFNELSNCAFLLVIARHSIDTCRPMATRSVKGMPYTFFSAEYGPIAFLARDLKCAH